MARLRTELGIALGLSTVLTVSMAWPVVTAPTQRIFGTEIVGRRHDAYTVMQQMAFSGPMAPFIQPLTDYGGWLFARWLHPVAAYNLLILLTFPLTTAATFALARYLSVPRAGALFAGLAFAFAPFHLAHAAYHPHVAQTQWLPLYFLALFALVDRPSVVRGGLLALACAALVLSSFYSALIGAVLSPVALAAYWWWSPVAARRLGQLLIPAGVLAALAVVGLAALWFLMPSALTQQAGFAFSIKDVGLYSASGLSYVVPPIDHPVVGWLSSRVLRRAGATGGLVEQQVSMSAALLLLCATAATLSVRRWRALPQWRPVMALSVVGLAAVVVSLGPSSHGCLPGSWVPACRLHSFMPAFRAYARFAIVAHLAAATAAGLGLALLAKRSVAGLLGACTLAGIVAFEYSPFPWRAHDVLPTQGHRWLAGRDAPKSLDCSAFEAAQMAVPWLMNRQLSFLGDDVTTCLDPRLGDKLAVLGYTHVVVRRVGAVSPLAGVPPRGLLMLAEFPDSRVYRVAADVPPVLTLRSAGFTDYRAELPGESADAFSSDWWRWLPREGRWVARNTTSGPLTVWLSVQAAVPAGSCGLHMNLDGQAVGTVVVGTGPGTQVLGPWILSPGDHALTFAAAAAEPSKGSAAGPDVACSVPIGLRREEWITQRKVP